MAANFHEHYQRAESPLPSDRSTGLVLAGASLIVALIWRETTLVVVAASAVAFVLGSLSFVAPACLRPVNVGWMAFGALLGRILNPVVMLGLYALVIVPAGLIMQRFRDPLRRQKQVVHSSYWIERGPDSSSDMRNQF